jgi:integrase
MKDRFTPPKLNKTSKYWYIHYRYDGVQFRDTYGINKIEDLKLRERSYNKICADLLIDLKNGFNPNISEDVISQNDMNIIQALNFGLHEKKGSLKKESFCSYSGTVRFLETAAKTLKMENLKIVDLKRIHVKSLLTEVGRVREKWTNNTYNTHLLHLKIILYVLVKEDIIESNPATKIDNKKVDKESSYHKPASELEIEKIKKALFDSDFNFYIFCITIFHTGIRPGELLRVNLGMVDLVRDEFNLPGTMTKNGNARTVPINKYLKEYYANMNFSELPVDYYLFGSFKSQGKGKKKKENKLLPNFIPSEFPTVRKTAGDKWREIVKDGLGIEMNLYAMKHYGADQKILAGMSMDSLRELYGHSSKLMTEKYAKIIKEVYRKDIMDNSPDF